MPRVRSIPLPKLVSRSVISRRRSRLLSVIASLPQATATSCGGDHLSLEVRGKRFGYYLDNHHGDQRVAISCKAEPGGNQALVEYGPDRFHIPAYVGSRGWVGLWLDLLEINWEEVESILSDAYRLTASKRLISELDSGKKRKS